MAQDYLNIIGNWNSMAQQGRERANAAMETKLKTFELQAKNQMLQKQNEEAAEARISNITQQAEYLSKFYRPGDLKKMQDLERDAKAKLKEQLNMYNDDIVAFMRGGGRQHINEYRDSILNSEEAQIIRNNHGSLVKYLDQSDEDATLISDRDRENYNRWKAGNIDSFTWSGSYMKLLTPTEEEFQNANSPAEAYLDKSNPNGEDNYSRVLHNYLIDKAIDFGADGRGPEEYYQELLIYQNSQLRPDQISTAKKSLSESQASKKSYSSNIQSIFNSINGGYQGNFDGFWADPANNSALINLENLTWIQPYNVESGRNKRLYGQQILGGEEMAIAKEFFPNMENGKVDFDDLTAMQSNLGAGGVYDEDGYLIPPGVEDDNDAWFNPNDNWKVNALELMFEVKLDDGKTKLMSIEDLDENENLRDKNKSAVMVMSFSENDGYQLGLNPDDFRYMKLNLESPRVAQKIDKVLGKVEYTAKQNVANAPKNYRYVPGERFDYLPENVNALVPSLDPYVGQILGTENMSEDDLNSSSLLMATAMLNHEQQNPYQVLKDFMGTTDPDERSLIDALKNYDYDAYYNILSQQGATEKDLRELAVNTERIRMGYLLYGERKEN